MKRQVIILATMLSGFPAASFAQRTTHSSMWVTSGKAKATAVPFKADADISEYLIPQEPIKWGMDVAWDNEDNVRRGTNYIGKDVMATGRISFQPSDLVDENGNLSVAQQNALQARLDHISLSGVRDVILNCDHEKLNKDNYYGKPEEWYRVIKASVLYAKNKGFNVITISPFNEPDYDGWGEGTKDHFKAIAKLISEDPALAGIRISAGNTLNCDKALEWYNYMLPYATEGNTHQLAGSFKNYADFWQKVRNDGNYATADELHNVGEAFIGAHYGMQSGVWWGWDGAARGEYCRASFYGKEISYAENRDAWSAATVYKRNDGRMDAFLGTSERQATKSSYEFISTDRPVFFDGYGPTYSYSVEMPGGTGYQQGQTNAERMVLIHSGEDAPLDPIKNGTYVIMNMNAKLCLGTYDNKTESGRGIALRKYTLNNLTPNINDAYQWNLEMVPTTGQGDLGYFWLFWKKDPTLLMDIKDWSTSAGASIINVRGGKGTNEQWFLEYAGNDSWYIRSRHSGLYLEVKNAGTSANNYIQQAAFTGNPEQQWRFMPVEAKPKLELDAPTAPTNVSADIQSGSIKLSWTANSEEDILGYNIFRKNGDSYDMIGRMVEGTEFIDNDITPGQNYTYKIKAVDNSRNQSETSTEVSATANSEKALMAHYDFEDDTNDATINILDGITSGSTSYSSLMKKSGKKSLYLKGSDGYLTLPPSVGNLSEMTIAMWVNINNTNSWQRIFDFGNGTNQYFFLTPSNGSEMRLVMKNGGDEQILSTTKATTGWHYVAVTLAPDAVTLYVDGNATTSNAITIRPSDFHPKRNYIGRSQYTADPFFVGYIDDLRIYNYALSADEVETIRNGGEVTSIKDVKDTHSKNAIYNLSGVKMNKENVPSGIYIQNGKKRIAP